MALDLAVLKSRIRKEAGDPSDKEISDATIAEFIDDALNLIGENVVAWATFHVTSEKDKQDYLVDTSIFDVLFCDWQGDVKLSDVFDADFALLDVSFYSVETGIYNRIRDALIRQQVQERFNWQFREHDRKLILVPPPTTTGTKIYYIGMTAWTLAKCPPRFERYITWYGTAETLKVVARKKKRLSAIAHTGGTFPWTLADPTLADARTLEAKFRQAMDKEARKSLF